MKKLISTFCLFGFLIFCLVPSIASAHIGEKLSEVKDDSFFSFFNLGEIDRIEAQKGSVITFRPRSGDFSQLVSVKIIVDSEGTVMVMELALSRSFVDDPFNGVFARDISKSILQFALPKSDAELISEMIDEIRFRNTSQNNKEQVLPKEPSSGYLTYVGSQERHEEYLEASKLLLENKKRDGVNTLIIAVQQKIDQVDE